MQLGMSAKCQERTSGSLLLALFLSPINPPIGGQTAVLCVSEHSLRFTGAKFGRNLTPRELRDGVDDK